MSPGKTSSRVTKQDTDRVITWTFMLNTTPSWSLCVTPEWQHNLLMTSDDSHWWHWYLRRSVIQCIYLWR